WLSFCLCRMELANRIAGIMLASACAIMRKMLSFTVIRSKEARMSPVVACGSIRGSRANWVSLGFSCFLRPVVSRDFGALSKDRGWVARSCHALAALSPSARPGIRAATKSRTSPRIYDAALSLPHHHPWPQHGGRPRPLARDRHEERSLWQADHRRRQFLHSVRARACASAEP